MAPSEKKYSNIWFNPDNFHVLDKFKNLSNINFLEIGSFEGYGTNYFIENFLNGDNSYITCIDPWIKYSDSTVSKLVGWDNVINESTYDIFINNTIDNSNKIIIKKELSVDILPILDTIYDFIYIDGDHTDSAVWVDAVLSFKILNIGGIMIFDDYWWDGANKNPNGSINKFLDRYKNFIEVLFVNTQVGIKKIKHDNDIYITAKKYISQINLSFKNAEEGISKISEDIISMEGMTGTKTRHFYNNLLNMEDVRYLEIGTWKGSSVCSAMYQNNAKILCMDNWSDFWGPKEEFLVNFNKYKGTNDAVFIENDCFKVDVSSLPKFNIYMYDGGHTESDHYTALKYYYNCLDDLFIFIVDDWNWNDVRKGTLNVIKDLKLECLYKKEIRLTTDGSHTPEDIAKKTWHNGICVFVLKK